MELSSAVEATARNPQEATVTQLRAAMRHLSYRRASIILSARRRGVEPRGLEHINEQLALYAELLNGRK